MNNSELETLLADNFCTAIARELILERHETINEVIFTKVMDQVLGVNGKRNAFDAPILYEILTIQGV
jgi:hypothetical protein